MPTPSYELTKLDTNTFEHLGNALALKVLGAGHTGFGPGADGGRDGYFEGNAPYPSSNNSWSGIWYLQSKFLAPHLTKDSQKWLLERIKEEIDVFSRPDSPRKWPDNWIILTNIEPSGAPQTGSFDRAREMVKKARPQLAKRFHIWGGRKVLDLLALYPDIGEYYAEFLTAGQVLSRLYTQALDAHAQAEQIIRYLIATQFNEQQYTKLEQAWSTTDNRPGIQRLFADVPFFSPSHKLKGMAAATLAQALAQTHKIESAPSDPELWKAWQRSPVRARIWFVKGGPGQGKSTLTQYISQIQRAAFILEPNGPNVLPPQRALAEEIRNTATKAGLWPMTPRVPVIIDLKEFAFWFGRKAEGTADRMIAFLVEYLTAQIGEEVKAGTLRRIFSSARWLFVFDGLDEVPGDVKDAVANEVTHFTNDVLIGCRADASIVCTSRPQGYSGQFSSLDAALVELVSLSREQALACAEPLLALDRSESERRTYVEMLREALQSGAIAEIMTTPLQAHIMAVIVRDGGKPPERKWQLFNTFYEIIKKREANRNLPDRKLATLLREGDKLLKALHNRLGFELHARAETSQGASTSLNRTELLKVVRETVSQLQDSDVEETVSTLMRATTERLVLVSTPEAGDYVRFDIRPLQEFFAAEHIYQSGEPATFIDRIRVIAGDSHWREVMHFLLSALIENNRKAELAAAITVLIQIDGGGDRGARVLNRRLARGGIIAARLLQEGVVEQDKRVREQFRGCILPLLGCIDASEYLSGIRPNHSLQWLLDVLITSLHEQAESETIGVINSLVNLLPESDVRTETLKQLLMNASASYHRFFLEELGDRNIYERRPAPRWVTECAMRLLLRDDWWSLGANAISSAIEIISSAGPEIRDIATDCGVHPEIGRIVALLLSSERQLHSTIAFSERRYGILEINYFKPPDELNWKSWTEERWSALKESTGILRSAFCTFDLVRSPSKSSLILNAFLDSLGGRIQNYRLLPSTVRAYIADKYIATPSEKLPANDLLERDRPGYIRTITLRSEIHTQEIEWAKLVRDEPWLSLYLLTSRQPKELKDLEYAQMQDVFLEALPLEVILSYTASWGVLFALPGKLGPGLRDLALKAATGPVNSDSFGSAKLEFKIDLPKEAEMLPHLVGALLERISEHRIFPVHEWTRRPERQAVSRIISAYIPSPEVVHDIAANHKFSKRIRAAAKILYLLDPRASESSIRTLSKESFVDFYEPSESHWFLSAVALVLTDEIAANQPDALETIGSLLERANMDFNGRRAVNSAIRSWRELARAPVQHLAAPQLWV